LSPSFLAIAKPADERNIQLLCALQERVPSKIRRLLGECLQKDPKLRLRDIGDAKRLLMESGAEGPSQTKVRAMWVPWASAVVLFALAAVSLAFVHFREAPPRKTVLRYTIAAPEKATNLHSFAISPDGRHIAIAAAVNGRQQLWLRALDALQALPQVPLLVARQPLHRILLTGEAEEDRRKRRPSAVLV
jgi:hypothetical protein